MCFSTTKGTRLRIAKEDIIVYKRGKRLAKGTKFGANCQTYFSYERNVRQPKVKLVKINNCARYSSKREIYKGYHSYIDKPGAAGQGRVLGLFIIPKGAGYYQNRMERVSETIIWKDFIKVSR